MTTEPNVLEEIQREVKGFGENVSGLKASLERDLAAVRKLAEETKGAIGPEVKSQIDAFSASVTEKHAAIETQVKAMQAQAERVETALNRHPTGAAEPENAAEMKDALAFFEMKAAVSGQRRAGARITADKVDREGYKSWVDAFDLYLRADERAVEAKALSVGSNPEGGYLVPTATSARIITKIFESSPIRQLATIETIGSAALEVPVDIDEAAAGWVGETQARTETGTPQVSMQRIPVGEIYAKPKATQQMLEDAGVNVENWLAGKVADKFSRIEATAFVSGDGVNKPRGILTYPAGMTRGAIQQVNSGDANLITADAIVKMPFAIKSAYLANAGWMMKRSTVQAIMLLKDTQNQYLWRPGLTAGQPSMLVGYAVNMADDMPVVAAGALPVAFGDFRAGYTVVDRLGITTLRDPFSAKPFVEFYSRKRVGGDVTDFDAFAVIKISA